MSIGFVGLSGAVDGVLEVAMRPNVEVVGMKWKPLRLSCLSSSNHRVLFDFCRNMVMP